MDRRFPDLRARRETGKIDFEHNPFLHAPGRDGRADGRPLEVLGYQYDLACNGYELGVGRDPEPPPRDHVQSV